MFRLRNTHFCHRKSWRGCLLRWNECQSRYLVCVCSMCKSLCWNGCWNGGTSAGIRFFGMQILMLLDPFTLASCMRVCKAWRTITASDRLWQRLLHCTFRLPPTTDDAGTLPAWQSFDDMAKGSFSILYRPLISTYAGFSHSVLHSL